MLFTPIEIRGLTAKNRLMMSAMCQYSAEDGFANAWHQTHYVSRAVGQAGLISLEMTAVHPLGRITPGCLGIWKDEHVAGLRTLVDECHRHGAMVGVQLGHAGRKGEFFEQGLVGPSPIRFFEKWPEPHALSTGEVEQLVACYGAAARRAHEAGFDYVEVHAAHGYLINQFTSPLSNRRDDAYGRDPERFLREVLQAVRAALPQDKPIFMKVSGIERDEGGAQPEEVAERVKRMAQWVDLVIASSGAMTPTSAIKFDAFPGYQVPFAELIRKHAGVRTAAVGVIENALVAEEVLKNGRADIVAVGRPFLRDPYFPIHAARTLGVDIAWPKQYGKAKQDWVYHS
jgi:NADPH2 dehydrogenase